MSAPLCSRCKRREARAHHAIGFYRQCARCLSYNPGKYARRKARRVAEHCRQCGIATVATSWCSAACATASKREARARRKAAVIRALGGMCSCEGIDCYHEGRCGITAPDVLTVDHVDENGGMVRRLRRDGSVSPYNSTCSAVVWSRYSRALTVPNHGMRLLCHNCHNMHTQRCTVRRRAVGDQPRRSVVVSRHASRRREPGHCAFCNTLLVRRRATRRYCNTKCRVYDFRWRGARRALQPIRRAR